MSKKKGLSNGKSKPKGKLKSGTIGVDYGKKHRKDISRSAQLNYIRKNSKNALEKMRYLQKTGAYKGSTLAQEANAQLRFVYKKYGLDPDKIHSTIGLLDKMSNMDLKTIYNAITDIRAVNTRQARKNYESIKAGYEEKGISYDEQFNLLSTLSKDFHEVFAFLSYNQIETLYSNTQGKESIRSVQDVLGLFKETISDKVLNEQQTERAKKLLFKEVRMGNNNKELSPKQYAKLLKDYRKIFK